MGKRQSIYTDAFAHSNPIPAACRVGNILMTGIVNGIDPKSASGPGSFEAQCALMFNRVREIMSAAGGSTEQIVKLNIAVTDIEQRAAINAEWVKMFPDPHNRPVRHTVQSPLDRGKLIQCDIIAWMD
ncbi:MAG: RidA family protein [Alphaproteobacteria bacterium]|nr:RidA family protein [Alphaproteobacteria bacterium]